MATAIDSKAKALHRHLDNRIENLERKNYHNRELITNLKKEKLKIKDRLYTLSLQEQRKSKEEQLDLFSKGETTKHAT
tara:strand:+ start:639 stop:872 length:234 start_codon:yes stop_codon:yes gene_type:complete